MAKAVQKQGTLYDESHLKLIAEHPHILGHIAGFNDLTEMHSEWVRYIWDARKNVSLFAHRGSFKSTGVTVTGAVWRLLFHPDEQILITRKTHGEAVETVAGIAKMISTPEIYDLFWFAHGEPPVPRIERIGEGKIDYAFKHKATISPSILGMGMSSPMTGKHSTYTVCDDISTLKDRLSRAEREYTKQIWMELSQNVTNRGCPCCYVGTPWHKDGVESIIPTPKIFTCYETGLMTEKQIEEKRAGTTPTLFSCNYELKFVPSDGAMFKDPQWGEWLTSGIESPRAQIDVAYGGGDWCALTIAARRHDKKIQVIGFAYHGNIVDWLDFVTEKLKFYKVRKIYLEFNTDKGFTSRELRKRGFATQDYPENTQKQHKIATYLRESWESLLFCPETDGDYMVQITDWTAETKESDDCPDGLASLLRACYSKKASTMARWQE